MDDLHERIGRTASGQCAGVRTLQRTEALAGAREGLGEASQNASSTSFPRALPLSSSA